MSDNEMWEAMNEEAYPEETEAYKESLPSDASDEDKRAAWERLMDRAKVAGPNKDKAKEFLTEDDAEFTEVEGPSLVGTMSTGTTTAASITHSSYPPYLTETRSHTTVMPGGGVTWSPASPIWSPTPPASVPATPITPAAKPGRVESVGQVPMPPKFTPKVLLAFLEENDGMEDGLVWAAHLLAQHFEMRLEDGEIRLVMEFSLRDYYGNNPSKD